MERDAPGPVIYSARKVVAERTFWQFKQEQKLAFTMAAVNPVFVAGPPLVVPDSRI
jgi:hypothetical protein